jgi:capsular polysaccharide biosynthesis protein
LIVNAPLAPWQIESLQLMGFGEDELLFLDDGYHKFETLYFPSHIGINPLTLNWLRDKMLPAAGPRPSKRVYVTRRLASRRRVLNEKELEPLLLDHGFVFVDLETFSFADQVRTFSEAEMIVAIHGAGLTNMVWAPPGCKIMEIMDPNHVSLMYYVLSEVLGQTYWYCGGKATGTTDAWRHGGAANHGDIAVPAELFRDILSDMVAKNSSFIE